MTERFSTTHEPLDLSTCLEGDLWATAAIGVTIVIPAFNEELRIGATLDSCGAHMQRLGISYEILIVDDGSQDGTATLVRSRSRSSPAIRLESLDRNRGKGAAVRHGVMAARGALILINDADGATPITEIDRLLREMASTGADLVIGSRAIGSRDTVVERRTHRHLAGRLFAALVNCLAVPGIRDTQCGFKLMKATCAREVFAVQKLDRFSFDVEVLYLARKMGFHLREVPVNWHDVAGSKVSLATDSLKMLRDILRIRRLHREDPPRDNRNSHA